MAEQTTSPRQRKNVSSPVADARTPNSMEAGLSKSAQPVVVVQKTNNTRRAVIAAGVVLGVAAVATVAGVVGSKTSAASSSRKIGSGGSVQGMSEAERIQAAQNSLAQYSVCPIKDGLGVAAYFNGFFSGSFSGTQCDVQGRLGVQGNAVLSSYGVGDRLFSNGVTNGCPNPDLLLYPGSQYTLVVGGNLNANNGQVYFGGVSYGGSLSTSNSFTVPSTCSVTHTSNTIDFADAWNTLEDVSDSIASLATPLSYSELEQYGRLALYLRGTTDTEYFIVTAAQLQSSNQIQFINSPLSSSTTVIINVVGGPTVTLTNKDIQLPSGLSESQMLWNFNGFSSLTISLGFKGTVLAPGADIFSNGNSGEFHGNLYGDDFGPVTGQTKPIQLDYFPFTGTVFGPCTCVPTPTEICVADPGVDPLIADNVQALFFGDFCLTNSDVQGKLLVGGDATISGSGVGDRLPGADACSGDGTTLADFSLVVGGALTISNSRVFKGGVIYVDDDGVALNSDGGVGAGCPIVQGSLAGVDFASLRAQYVAMSSSMATLTANAQSQLVGNQLVFILDNTLDEIVFVVSKADLEAAEDVTMLGNVKNSFVTITIIVTGGGTVTIQNKAFQGSFSLYQQQIVWNFDEFFTINVGGVQWLGSILAPYADFETIAGGGEIHGDVVGQSMGCNVVPTVQLDYFPFLGDFVGPCANSTNSTCP